MKKFSQWLELREGMGGKPDLSDFAQKAVLAAKNAGKTNQKAATDAVTAVADQEMEKTVALDMQKNPQAAAEKLGKLAAAKDTAQGKPTQADKLKPGFQPSERMKK